MPISPQALARDSARVAAAGVGAVHLHVKDISGADTLDGEHVAAALTAIRTAVPGLPVGVTTGAWAVADPEQRAELVRTWQILPDFASVNWHEAGAVALAEALLQRGIGVEAGLWDSGAVESWLKWPYRNRCLRVLLELPDGLDATETAKEGDRLLAAVAGAAGRPVPILLHGEGSSCWPALRHGVDQSLATRIGLEDTLELPDGTPAQDNLALVKAAVEIMIGSRREADLAAE